MEVSRSDASIDAFGEFDRYLWIVFADHLDKPLERLFIGFRQCFYSRYLI